MNPDDTLILYTDASMKAVGGVFMQVQVCLLREAIGPISSWTSIHGSNGPKEFGLLIQLHYFKVGTLACLTLGVPVSSRAYPRKMQFGS